MFFLPSVHSSTPTVKMAVALTLCGLYLAMEVAAWFAFVPRAVSAQTFAWASILGLVATIAAVATIVGARPTRSIAHVLYDVEHPAHPPKV